MLASCFSAVLPSGNNRGKVLLMVHVTPPVAKILKVAAVPRKEQLEWVMLWARINADDDARMDYSEFRSFFRLVAAAPPTEDGGGPQDDGPVDADDETDPEVEAMRELFNETYTRRLFEMMNTEVSTSPDTVSFRDFFTFSWRYCVFSRARTSELAFRLLVSKGGHNLTNTSALVMADLKMFWLTHVVPFYGLPRRNVDKTVRKIFARLDEDNGGSLTCDEFSAGAGRMEGFLKVAYAHQAVLRRLTLGDEYWRKATARQRGQGRLPSAPADATEIGLFDRDFAAAFVDIAEWERLDKAARKADQNAASARASAAAVGEDGGNKTFHERVFALAAENQERARQDLIRVRCEAVDKELRGSVNKRTLAAMDGAAPDVVARAQSTAAALRAAAIESGTALDLPAALMGSSMSYWQRERRRIARYPRRAVWPDLVPK